MIKPIKKKTSEEIKIELQMRIIFRDVDKLVRSLRGLQVAMLKGPIHMLDMEEADA